MKCSEFCLLYSANYIIKCFIIIREINPGIPKKPVINTVKILNGRCKLINCPRKFAIKRVTAPKMILIVIFLTIFIGSNNAFPTKNNNIIPSAYEKTTLYCAVITSHLFINITGTD